MGKIILTYNDIADLNQFLEERGINCNVHMHDLCGSQSFTVKPMDLSPEEELTVKKEISNFFHEKGISLTYADHGLEFVINQG